MLTQTRSYDVTCKKWNDILIYLFLFFYLWLCWVFVSVRGLSPVAASGGHSSSRCAGLSLSRPLLLRSTGSRCPGSVVVAHRPSCSVACGILPGQGSNPCPLHWQVDSQPLRHQGSPKWYDIDHWVNIMLQAFKATNHCWERQSKVKRQRRGSGCVQQETSRESSIHGT